MPVSLVTSNGIEGYRAFKFNTQKHKETPLTNYMGLRTVVAYSPSEAGRVMKDDRQEDPWGPWKKQKLVTFHNRFPFYLLLALGFVALLYTALRDAEPWVACAMGTMMIAVGVELTCYYYSFMFATAFLYEKRKDAGAIMLGITAATGFFDWAPTRYLPDTKPWANLKMPQWLDEQYMWMSVATLLGFVWILYRFAYPPEDAVAGGRRRRGAGHGARGPARSAPKRASRWRGRGDAVAAGVAGGDKRQDARTPGSELK